MYGLYIDDVKGTCSSITNTMCVKYKKNKNLLLFWAWKVGLLQAPPPAETEEKPKQNRENEKEQEGGQKQRARKTQKKEPPTTLSSPVCHR